MTAKIGKFQFSVKRTRERKNERFRDLLVKSTEAPSYGLSNEASSDSGQACETESMAVLQCGHVLRFTN